MKQFMVVDIDSCWGCKTCTLACKMHDSIPVGELSPISIIRIENEDDVKEATCDFIPVICQHCHEPECLKVCPIGAIHINDESLVLIDRNLCIGCGKCEKACPFGAIATRKDDRGRKFAYKCDLCMERRSLGGKTYCEQHCPGEVFHCLSEDNVKEFIKTRKYSFSVGQVIYVSDMLSNLGSFEDRKNRTFIFGEYLL